MGQMNCCPYEEACGPDVGCEPILKRRGNKPRPRTNPKTMLRLSPADIKEAFDLVEDLILESYQACTNALWKEHLRALVVQYAKWRCEEGRRWESP